jgi:chitin disaccharide deacetylase
MTASKYLIVNGDDFGQSAGINRGIIEAHERGILTSASLMVRWPFAAEAADYARAHPELSVGLHLDLGEWICRDHEWQPLYWVVDTNDADMVTREVDDQIERCRSLLGNNPTHLDSHQHAHLQQPARSIIEKAASKLGCPLRSCDCEITYVGDFYGQTADGISLPENISVDGLLKIVRDLPNGITEMGCHPGYADDLDTMYKSERASEVAVLCDPRIRQIIVQSGIELISFAQLPVANPGQ